ncbi:unnamed protein product [Cyclocybe aegerita]|uniref:Uncharacterized protein n=1 Tax=Cyclocybe aegerita TaxID=1973307 RepID=A0A8S0VRW2_CYCAE|nr:unnamed protein product [Cyclocybe aegerita]
MRGLGYLAIGVPRSFYSFGRFGTTLPASQSAASSRQWLNTATEPTFTAGHVPSNSIDTDPSPPSSHANYADYAQSAQSFHHSVTDPSTVAQTNQHLIHDTSVPNSGYASVKEDKNGDFATHSDTEVLRAAPLEHAFAGGHYVARSDIRVTCDAESEELGGNGGGGLVENLRGDDARDARPSPKLQDS